MLSADPDVGGAESSRARAACGPRTVLLAFVEEVSVGTGHFQGSKGGVLPFHFLLRVCSVVQQANPPKQQGAGDAEEEEEEE